LQLRRKLDRFKHAHATVQQALQDVQLYQLSDTTRPTASELLQAELHSLTVGALGAGCPDGGL
jgi:hypothetical protein